MPGVGKTQLALRYTMLASRRSEDMYTFWVAAGSVEKLARDFSKLVDLLRLPGRHALDQVTKLTVASVARRSDSWEEVASHSGQRDPRDHQNGTGRDPSSTK